MGSLSIWHWVIVLVVVLLIFGKGKIPALMGDVAKGVKAFKSGLKDDKTDTAETKAIDDEQDEDTAMANKEEDEASRA